MELWMVDDGGWWMVVVGSDGEIRLDGWTHSLSIDWNTGNHSISSRIFRSTGHMPNPSRVLWRSWPWRFFSALDAGFVRG